MAITGNNSYIENVCYNLVGNVHMVNYYINLHYNNVLLYMKHQKSE